MGAGLKKEGYEGQARILHGDLGGCAFNPMLGMANLCSAGQTIKFHAQHIHVATRFDTMEIGDQPGHLLGFFQAKASGIRRVGLPEPTYKIELWGTMDYRADGTGTEYGYGKLPFMVSPVI
jgi:hypothetical protein